MTPAVRQVVLGGSRQFDVFVDSVNGSDASSGRNTSQAKQTLSAITWRAGLRVGLARGSVFRESTTISGRAASLIAYGSGNLPVLIGSTAIVSGWSNVSGNVWSQALATTPSNLHLRTSYTRTGITKLTKNTATPTTPGSGEWGFSSATLYVNSATDPNTLAFERVTDSGISGGLVSVSAADVLVQDIALLCGVRNGGYGAAGSDRTVWRRCDFSWNTNDGVGGTSGVSPPKDVLVESCYSWGNGYGVKDGSGADGDGVSFHGDGVNDYSSVTIRYCDIRYNTKSGIGNQTAVICDAYRNYLEANWSNIAVFATTYGGATPMVQRLWYNVTVRPTGEGRSLDTGIGAASTHDFRVEAYNNVFYSKAADSSIPGIYIQSTALGGAHLTLKMRNNIVKGFARGIQATDAQATLDLDYNDVSGNTTNYFDNGTRTPALSTVAGAHSITTDPLFTDAANGDFTLQGTSPCLNAGVDVGLTVDFAGNPVPFGVGPDIGAYERQS